MYGRWLCIVAALLLAGCPKVVDKVDYYRTDRVCDVNGDACVIKYYNCTQYRYKGGTTTDSCAAVPFHEEWE